MKFYRRPEELDFEKMFKELKKDEIAKELEKYKNDRLSLEEKEETAFCSVMMKCLGRKFKNNPEFREKCRIRSETIIKEMTKEEREFFMVLQNVQLEALSGRPIVEVAYRNRLPISLVREMLNATLTIGMSKCSMEDGKPVTDVIIGGNAAINILVAIEESLPELLSAYEKMIGRDS